MVVVVVVWRSHANRFSSFFSLTRVEKGIKRKFHSVLYTVRIVGSGTGSFSLSLSELISMSLAFWMESPKEKETSKQEEEEEEDQNDGPQGWMNRKHANPSKRLNPECLQQPQGRKIERKEWTEKKEKASSWCAVHGLRNCKPRPEALPVTHTHTRSGERGGGRRGATRFTALAHIFVVVVVVATAPSFVCFTFSSSSTTTCLHFPIFLSFNFCRCCFYYWTVPNMNKQTKPLVCCHPRISFGSILQADEMKTKGENQMPHTFSLSLSLFLCGFY